jgi:DnaK suppressor protein
VRYFAPVTAADLERVRAALLAQRAALLAEGAVEVRVEASEPVASAGDEDEAPYREMGQSIASARNRARAEQMVQVEEALRQLAEDPESYGLCEACQEPIHPGRLALMPFARLCVACQSGREVKGSPGRKKVTDYR